MFKKIIRKSVNIFEYILGIPIGILTRVASKKNNLIIMEGISCERYNENSRYLFEYLSSKKELDVFWITNDKEVHNYLLSHGLKSLKNGFEKLWHLLRAKMIIVSGSRYPNFLNSVGPKTIKYCLQHGVGPKVAVYFGKDTEKLKEQVTNINKFDFVNFTSKYTANIVGKVAYKIHYDKVKALGYPKNDHFFDKEKMDECLKKKQWCHSVFTDMNKESKVLLYTPTWRNNKLNKLPLLDLKGFKIKEFYNFLEKNNIYLLYSLHPFTKIDSKFKHPHIFYLDYEKYKTLDLNNVMPEVDLLLDDYSTTSTDFAILNRPQLFIMPDYDEYFEKDCFTEDYRAIMPGKEAHSYEELKMMILDQLKNPTQDQKLRLRFLAKYYDVSLENSAHLHYQFITDVLNINQKS